MPKVVNPILSMQLAKSGPINICLVANKHCYRIVQSSLHSYSHVNKQRPGFS